MRIQGAEKATQARKGMQSSKASRNKGYRLQKSGPMIYDGIEGALHFSRGR